MQVMPLQLDQVGQLTTESDSMDGTPTPPPEAELIRLAREALGLSISQAAEAVGASPGTQQRISTSRWSQIENGYEVRRDGRRREVRATPRMLAHMAALLGIDPARLAAQGQRPDAARVLEEILRREAEHAGPVPDDAPVAAPMLDQVDQERLRPYARGVLAEIQAAVAKHGPDPSGAQIFADPGEVEIWDTSPWSRADRVRGIAAMRLLIDDVLNPRGRSASGQLDANCNKTVTMGDVLWYVPCGTDLTT